MSEALWTLRSVRLGPGRNLPAKIRPRLEIDELQIPAGVTALIGKSGAGKTSLLNLLVGFEKPDRGIVQREFPLNEFAPISWVPPDFGLWPHLTVEEHLTSVAHPSFTAAGSLLSEFGLSKLATQRPETLSMGERARLSVARSLAMRAHALVMDEPFAHVDPGRIDRYWQALRESLNEAGASLVFSSHTPEVVLREADHLICLDDGIVAWTGTPAELYQSPPSESLAHLMGPVNWLEESERDRWSVAPSGDSHCIRPEQLEVSPDENSSLIVNESWCLGSYRQTEVVNVSSSEMRMFYHRPDRFHYERGSHVAIRILMTCLFLSFTIFLNGCRTSSGEAPQLNVSETRTYSLPSEGPSLPAPRGMTFDRFDNLYVLDNAGRVIVYDPAGNLKRRWWMPEYDVGKPEGAWVLLDGRIAVADTHYNRIVFFDKAGTVLGTLGEFGYETGQFIYTVAVTQDDQGFLYVAEYGGNDRIQKFTADGEFVTTFGEVGTEDGQFQRPSGIICRENVLYVADAINNRIQAFTSDGKFLRIVADAQTAGLYYPYDLAQGPDGTLFVAEYGAGRISRISLEGKVLGRYGQEGRGDGEFWTLGIAVSRNGKIAVADTGNRRVVELDL